MITRLIADDIRHLGTGAHFLACTIDPMSVFSYADMIEETMKERRLMLVDAADLAPDDLVVAVGMVSHGFTFADMPPAGDEFVGCVEAIEATMGQQVRGIYPLAAASINGMVPAMVALQMSLPVIDADPMGRVFPLISQTTLNLAAIPIGPIALMGVAGDRAVVEVGDAQRAETLVRSLVTDLGGWAATAMYPCAAAQLRQHGIPGSVSRMIRIGEVLDSDRPTRWKHQHIARLLGAKRITNVRVVDIEGASRPSDVAVSALPSSISLVDEESGQVVRLEIQNEIVLVLVDGGTAAAIPDIVSLVNTDDGTVVDLSDIREGDALDVVIFDAAPPWYREDGLRLAGPRAFGIPLDHPRQGS